MVRCPQDFFEKKKALNMKVLIHDHGLCLEVAVALARAGHNVGYYVSPSESHSRHDIALIGKGFNGVDKIDDFYSALDRSDVVLAMDTHSGDEVDWLRSKGYHVWGAGARAERLELDRWHSTQLLHKAKLPTPGTQHVVGVPQLLIALLKSTDCFVKCCGYREVETFHHTDWPTTQEQFVAPLLCAYGTDPDLDFVLVDPVDPAVEVGEDDYVVKGQHPTIRGYGYEDKDNSYLGTWTSTLPKSLSRLSTALSPTLETATSFISTEVRVTPNGDGYPVDLTIRAAHPPLAGMLCSIVNLPNILTGGALEYLFEPRMISYSGYVAVLVGSSGWMTEHSGEITFPEKIRDYVKFSKAWHKDGHYFVVPSDNYAVQVVGLGPTIDQAIDLCHAHADQVTGKDLTFDKGSLQKLATEVVPKGRRCGIPF